jgi:phospho-N-acetylmuramoyl-pentapeptide-transferase
MASLFGPFLVGVLVALLSGSILIPLLRRLKAGQAISSDAPKTHQAKAGTPTMGGLIILVGAVVPALIYPHPSGSPALLGAVLLATLGFGLVGFLDDWLIIKRGKNLGLRAREKLAGQFVVAFLFAGWYWLADPSGIAFGQTLLAPWRIGLLLFHVLILVGLSNAVNLTDGLDGLAAGVSMPVWITLAVLGVFWNAPARGLGGGVSDYGIVVFCAGFAGATLGYLWYNAHPAQVFMGDTGSLAIGGGMAAAAIALRLEWMLLLAALVHLVEAASVTLQVISFKTTGKRIFKMSPLHHHFELVGWPETRVVARFAIVSALCGMLALALFFRG